MLAMAVAACSELPEELTALLPAQSAPADTVADEPPAGPPPEMPPTATTEPAGESEPAPAAPPERVSDSKSGMAKKEPPSSEAVRAGVAKLATPSRAQREPPPFGLDPGVLVGMGPSEVELVVGPPTAIRDEPPATVWSYQTDRCALEIFFYREIQTQRPRALAYAVKGQDQTDVAKQTCFSIVRAQRRT